MNYSKRKLLILSFFFLLILFVLLLTDLVFSPKKFFSLPVKAVEEYRPAHRNHPYGGVLRWGTVNPATKIDPVRTSHGVSMSIQELIFSHLVRINKDMLIEPELAERWEISDDGLMYTFYLRPGVLFHDGVELTAKDVVYTYEEIANPENNSPFRSYFDLVQRFEAVDTYIFRIILKEPFPSLLYKLVREILPRHLLKGKIFKDSGFGERPIGTGPFKFEHWDVEKQEVRLTANPVYFEGRPYLDAVEIKVYQDNSFLWAGLMRGEVDFVKFINKEDYEVLRHDTAFNVYEIPFTSYLSIVYNQQDPQLFDKQVRHSIARAIDIEELVRISLVEGIPSKGPFHPDSPGFNPGVEIFPYNPVRARMDLMARGWRDIDQDGVLEKGASELTLRLLVDQDHEFYLKLAKKIRQMLAEVGIKTSIIRYNDENELTEDFMTKYKPQAWLRFFLGLGLDPYAAAQSWFSESSQSGRIWNFYLEDIDRLFKQAKKETDLIKQAELYQQMHAILYDAQPACFLFFPVTFHAVRAVFKNTDTLFCSAMPVYTIKDWYVEPL